jgi:hypothetical protein
MQQLHILKRTIMSSHWDYVEKLVADHDQQKPFAPENGKPLKFAVGQRVVFTNDYGVSFVLQITRFYSRETDAAMYANGYRYLVDSSSPWFPVREASLTILGDSTKYGENHAN